MKPSEPLYSFEDEKGTFRVVNPQQWSALYFPLVNEAGLMSAVSPDLHGDIKLDQHSFLTPPVATEDLQQSRAARNFWLAFPPAAKKGDRTLWSVAGRSAWQRALPDGAEPTVLDAGLLWHRTTRGSKKLGITATVLSFVPVTDDTLEVLFVEIKNTGRKPVQFTATSAIPLYGRSADNLRDHRHVTSLLNRLKKESHGISLKPTMTFNERGHLLNGTTYYVLGVDGRGKAPAGFYPTLASFVGEGGDLERPRSLLSGTPPQRNVARADQGKEAIGALQFAPTRLAPGQSAAFVVLMGICRQELKSADVVRRFSDASQVREQWQATQDHWLGKTSQIVFKTGDKKFNQWTRWVTAQPIFRKLFGCSFLPDFDYGRGGRGWRDLWQDCLALILANPADVRDDIVHNFGGVRIDGSNATIIGRIPVLSNEGRILRFKPEFIADRNNIARTWMDHGIWPFLTTRLYLHQTGDWDVLLEEVPYFRDPLIFRGKKVNPAWAAEEKAAASGPEGACKLRGADKKVYRGTVLEHILVQTLVQFFNVGEHNNIRLEDADWNDGLDMAHDKGESVAFTSLYGGNLEAIAALLESAVERAGWTKLELAEELLLLLDQTGERVDYGRVGEKRNRLQKYFEATAHGVSGVRVSVAIAEVVSDLREKAAWIKAHLNLEEWIDLPKERLAWFNGYYDNEGKRLEGAQSDGSVRMTLTGQVFPIMAGTASPDRVRRITAAVDRLLFDRSLGGIRLNTDFGGSQPALGRAFSFAFGEKENGAAFSHMVVMYANALYQRGFSAEGYRALDSLYRMATSARAQIYPGLPEYFNGDARGRYSYLTGSASWYVLTLLTQVFGARGDAGDLLLSPQLAPEQFDRAKQASVEFLFAGTRVKVIYFNPFLAAPGRLRLSSIESAGHPLPFERRPGGEAVIPRSEISNKESLELRVFIDKI